MVEFELRDLWCMETPLSTPISSLPPHFSLSNKCENAKRNLKKNLTHSFHHLYFYCHFNFFQYFKKISPFAVVIWSFSPLLSFCDLFHTTTPITDILQINKHTSSTPQLLPCCSPTLCGEKYLNADICHMHLAADIEVSPMFRRDFFFSPPRPNQVTVNFPAVSEQASDKAQPNRTDGWALFAFCCYLFMCLFFLSLSPLIQRPSILSCPSPRCQRGNTVLLHQVWYVAPLNPCLQLCVLNIVWYGRIATFLLAE